LALQVSGVVNNDPQPEEKQHSVFIYSTLQLHTADIMQLQETKDICTTDIILVSVAKKRSYFRLNL